VKGFTRRDCWGGGEGGHGLAGDEWRTSFSQSWSVLYPSCTVHSASVTSVTGSREPQKGVSSLGGNGKWRPPGADQDQDAS
jgi:hypothetical protein